MNAFFAQLKSKIEAEKSYVISKHMQDFSVDNLAKRINKDFPCQENEFNVLYCYSLINSEFLYPNGNSPILYIGQSAGEKHHKKKDLGFRFKHCKEGSDNKINVCLSNYYQKGTVLLLEIFSLKKGFDSKAEEKELRKEFLKQYKSYPIADGASYKK